MDLRLILLIATSGVSLTGIAFSMYRFIKNKRFYHLMLGVLFFGFFLSFSSELGIAIAGKESSNFLVILLSYLFFPAVLLIAPSIHLYIDSFTTKSNVLPADSISITRHYFPALILLIINLFSLIALSQISPESNNYNLLFNISQYINFITLFIVFLLQNVFYFFLTFKIFNSSKSYHLSEENKKTLQWLYAFAILFFLIFLFTYLFQVRFLQQGKIVFRVSTFIYLLMLLIFGNRFYKQLVSTTDNLLNKDEWNSLKGKIVELMENQKIFLDKNLTLADLSKKLGSNTKYVSKLINQEFGLNVSSYINKYRIEEAKKVLSDPDNHIFTLETIAEMIGYNSKSSFNVSFKKMTGMTPSEFKKQMLEKL